MTLTVPKSTAQAGFVAQRANMPAPQGGANFARLGDALAEISGRVLEDQLDREMQRNQVEYTRQLNDLSLQVRQIGDPDEAEATWASGVQHIRESYLTAPEGEQARVNKRNRDRFEIAFDTLANRHAYSIGARALDLRQAQRQANVLQLGHELERTYAVGDPDTRVTAQGQFFDAVDANVAAGVYDAAEAERIKQRFLASGDNARAIALIGADPEGFQAARAAGEFSGLSAEQLARYDTQAAGAIKAAQDKATKEQEKAAKARATQIGDRLGEMRDIFQSGREAVDEVFLDDPEVKAHPDYPQTAAARDLRNEGKDLATMSPAQLRALIAEERDTKIARKWQAERLDVLEATLAAHEKGYATDPIAYARSIGRDVPDVDMSDPMAAAQGILERVSLAQDDLQAGFTVNPRYLSNEEREQLRGATGPKADPAERAQWANAFGVVAGSLDAETLDALDLDPVFLHTADLAANGLAPATARRVFEGQQVIEAGNVVLPPLKERLSTSFSVVNSFFSGRPNGQQQLSRIFSTADAIYAENVQKTDPTAPIDEAKYEQALHEAMGGTGTLGARNAAGGLQVYNDALTPLPSGIRLIDVETSLSRLASDLGGERTARFRAAELDAKRRGGQAYKITRLDPMEARARADAMLQRVSRSGGQPVVGGEPLDPKRLETAQLVPVGNGQYGLRIGKTAVMDSNSGGLWRFDLLDLIWGYAE